MAATQLSDLHGLTNVLCKDCLKSQEGPWLRRRTCARTACGHASSLQALSSIPTKPPAAFPREPEADDTLGLR